MQLRQFFAILQNSIHSASTVLHKISTLVLFLLMIVMAIDVLSRYVLGNAISGSIDIVVVLMAIFIFLSFPDTTLHKTHVRTDLLYDRLSKRTRAVFDIITIGLSAVFTLIMSWQLGARALYFINNPPGISTEYFHWPHYPFILLGAVCCFLMFLELLIWVIQAIRSSIEP